MDQLENKLFNHILIGVSALVVFGLIMVYSSSYIYAKETFGEPHHFILRQVVALGVGCMFAFLASRIKFDFWYRHGQFFLLMSSILLALTLIPGLGLVVKGSSRWISLGFISFQPSEVEKFALLMASINFFNRYQFLESREKFWTSLQFLFPLVINLIQPDYGTFSIGLAIIVFTCFLSPFSRPLFYSFATGGLLVSSIALVIEPYRVRRLLVFLDPWADPKGHGFQIIQSYLGFANGKIFGQGIGNSNEKLFYLPEAHNDFILSVIGEEFGFLGVMFIATMFLYLMITGLRLSMNLRDPRHALCAASCIFTICFQAFLNMGVVLGLLPTKGLNLPFVSYGGSSLVANLLILGLVASAFRADQKAFSSGATVDKMTRVDFQEKFSF